MCAVVVYLAEELRRLLGVRRLQSVRQERVQAGVHALLSRLLVPHLKGGDSVGFGRFQASRSLVKCSWATAG